MHLETVWIENLRCIKKAQLNLSPTRNVVVGDNGAGKSSLLEALYVLGRGQSFRSSPTRRLIADLELSCLVRARVQPDQAAALNVAVQKQADANVVSIAGNRNVKLSELARVCPVIAMEPGQHRLLEDGPVLRRRYLDWSVFHVEHSYLIDWQRFTRALKQRNALLRTRSAKQLSAWNQEFVLAAERVDQQREKVFLELRVHIEDLLARLLGQDHQVSVQYRRGWPTDASLVDQLDKQQLLDLEQGYTHSGPQRAEIRLLSSGSVAKDGLSRGQQKLVVTAMLLGQAQHFRQRSETCPLLLVDDFASELGESARSYVMNYLETYPGQSVITCLDTTAVSDVYRSNARMFHVKHGEVTAVL